MIKSVNFNFNKTHRFIYISKLKYLNKTKWAISRLRFLFQRILVLKVSFQCNIKQDGPSNNQSNMPARRTKDQEHNDCLKIIFIPPKTAYYTHYNTTNPIQYFNFNLVDGHFLLRLFFRIKLHISYIFRKIFLNKINFWEKSYLVRIIHWKLSAFKIPFLTKQKCDIQVKK